MGRRRIRDLQAVAKARNCNGYLTYVQVSVRLMFAKTNARLILLK
jgi:hypothetical protein